MKPRRHPDHLVPGRRYRVVWKHPSFGIPMETVGEFSEFWSVRGKPLCCGLLVNAVQRQWIPATAIVSIVRLATIQPRGNR